MALSRGESDVDTHCILCNIGMGIGRALEEASRHHTDIGFVCSLLHCRLG